MNVSESDKQKLRDTVASYIRSNKSSLLVLSTDDRLRLLMRIIAGEAFRLNIVNSMDEMDAYYIAEKEWLRLI